VLASGAVSASRVANPAWRDALQCATVAHVQSDGIPLHSVAIGSTAAAAQQHRPVSKWRERKRSSGDGSRDSPTWSESDDDDDNASFDAGKYRNTGVALSEVVTDLHPKHPPPPGRRTPLQLGKSIARSPFGTTSYSDGDESDPTPRPGPVCPWETLQNLTTFFFFFFFFFFFCFTHRF
jgi:hypothetical protein